MSRKGWRDIHVKEIFLSRLRERIDHQLHIIAQGIENRAGAAMTFVLLNLRPGLVRRAAGGDAFNQFVWHKLHGLVNLLPGSGPAEDALYPLYRFRKGAAGLSDMRLLREILGDQF